MKTSKYLIGIDISSETFTATVYDTTTDVYGKTSDWANTPEGFMAFHEALTRQDIHTAETLACMESTGVYAEALCYFLAAKGYAVSVEAPRKTKRAFHPDGPKTDPIDSRQLAEYALRFFDQLPRWTPPETLLEQIRVLLTTREQFTRQLTATKNTIISINRKVVRTPVAENALQQTVEELKKKIKTLDVELKRIVTGHDKWGPAAAVAMSIPGVGLLLTAHCLLMSAGFVNPLDARHMASNFGICPRPHLSGTSLRGRPQSRRSGSPQMRKLLYLASMSLRTHQQSFRHYFLRKVAEGKSKRLVLNNIANKLLKVIVAVLKSGTPFVPNYRSVNPLYLKKPLTAS